MLMFAPDNGKTKVHIKLHFTPEWNRNSGANWLKLDNYGGLGVFVIGRAYKATEAGGEEFEVSVGPGLTGEVLWVSIVPRPFEWEDSVDNHAPNWPIRIPQSSDLQTTPAAGNVGMGTGCVLTPPRVHQPVVFFKLGLTRRK